MTDPDLSSSPADPFISEPSEEVRQARRAVGLSAIVILLLGAAGMFAVPVIKRGWLERKSLFYQQFAAFEPAGMAILAVFAVAVLLMLRQRPQRDEIVESPAWLTDSLRTRVLIVVGVLAVSVVGAQLVFHGYLFIDDEYSGWFASVIYSTGRRAVAVPPEWCRWIAAMTPTSIDIQPPCAWQLRYLPVHSMIRAAFYAAGLDALAEPVLVALSALLVILIVRRVWPDRPDRAVLSGLFFACSTQVLMMSMTGFAMTAHLCFSLIWLWVYVHPARWALVLLPWVGVVAFGVHSPYPHILFAAPFVFRYLVQRRWIAGAYVAAVYVAGAAFWLGTYRAPMKTEAVSVAAPTVVAEATVKVMASPGAVARAAASVVSRYRQMFDGLNNLISLTVFATWSVPVALLFMLVALVLWKRLDGFAKWLAASLLFTLGARAIFFDYQGAGWGYRYGFAVLGNFAILAAIGADFVGDAIGRRRTYAVLGTAFIIAAVVQLPLRGFQAEGLVRPYYQTSEWMAAYPADVLIFSPDSVRYGSQLVRNDPFLRERPIIMNAAALGVAGITAVRAAFPGRVHVVTNEELTRFGLRW